MAYNPIENLLPKSGGSIYKLVRMAALRALELSDGRKPLLPDPSSEKLTSIALEEISKAKVVCKEVEDEFAEEGQAN